MIESHHASRSSYVFTSESVSEGHPDKICDQISDAVVDAMLTVEPEARAAVETLATTDHVTIAGEIRGAEGIVENQLDDIVRSVVRDIGYDQPGFNWETLKILNLLHEQSPDIAAGVDAGEDGKKDEGAGDQGIMFGYACNETEDLMPAPIGYANHILQKLSEGRHNGSYPELGPDAKSQVSLLYEAGKPVGVASVVLSTQHKEDVTSDAILNIAHQVVSDVLPEGWMPAEEEFYVNPTGKFVIGGPYGDAGLTGRKIIVDTYGGAAPHGGGAFSGKDPTKVDRSAAYMARYLAKNIVAAGLAQKCTIQLSFAIGVSHPISFYVSTHGTAEVDSAKLERLLPEMVNLSPRGIRDHLQLNKPIYRATAAYGHFGRTPRKDGSFSWERLDLVEELRNYFGA